MLTSCDAMFGRNNSYGIGSAPGDASWLDRAVLITLRLCLVGLVLFCLFRPVLILRAAVPQQKIFRPQRPVPPSP